MTLARSSHERSEWRSKGANEVSQLVPFALASNTIIYTTPEAAEDVPGTQQDTADASDLLALNHNDVLKEIEENDVQGQVAATTGQNAQPARQVASVECHVAPRNKKTKNVKYADSTDCLVCNQTVKRIDKHLINHKHLSSQITFIKDFHRTMNSQKQTKI